MGVDIHLAAAGGPFSFDSGIDMAIRRNDFAWPAGYHAERLFAEKVGPVCRPDKVDAWFSARRGSRSLKADVARLHADTAARVEGMGGGGEPAGRRRRGQTFDHFYFSLQAAVAGPVLPSARGISFATTSKAVCSSHRWGSSRMVRITAC